MVINAVVCLWGWKAEEIQLNNILFLIHWVGVVGKPLWVGVYLPTSVFWNTTPGHVIYSLWNTPIVDIIDSREVFKMRPREELKGGTYCEIFKLIYISNFTSLSQNL